MRRPVKAKRGRPVRKRGVDVRREDEDVPYMSEEILFHVPYLRRHARLLTGSKEVGDEYVRLCLELVVAEPERLEGPDLRTQLFAAFHAAWSALNPPPEPRADAPTTQEERLARGVAKLPPLERRVLLLSVVENLPPDQVGRILQLDEAEVRDLLARAREQIGRHTTAGVLVIEDEPIIAMELSQIVSEMGMTVIAAVARQDQAISAATPALSLVLADIQLEGNGNGIVAAREILQRFDVPIVFVTGFPERLLTGEGLEPAFVVAKPFTEAALKTTIAHALDIYDAPESAAPHRAQMLDKLRQITAQDLRDGSQRLH